jgi:hypothetical protein
LKRRKPSEKPERGSWEKEGMCFSEVGRFERKEKKGERAQPLTESQDGRERRVSVELDPEMGIDQVLSG